MLHMKGNYKSLAELSPSQEKRSVTFNEQVALSALRLAMFVYMKTR